MTQAPARVLDGRYTPLGTIARAYRELEQAGLIEGCGRRGTFVRVMADADRAEKAHRALSTAADHLAACPATRLIFGHVA